MNKVPGNIKKYLTSCFLLTIPIIAWNIFLTGKLPVPFQPAIFGNNIPVLVTVGEQLFRVLIFALTLLMPLEIKSRAGIMIYLAGVLLYFSSWLALIYYPHSAWSNSLMGFLAPALSPALWLTGIAITGNRFYFDLPYRRWIFLTVSLAFLIFHNTHTAIVYNRMH